MRLDWLKLGKFKNLQDFTIDFDERELSTVLIGENGTGKSNVIEAIVQIFRDLDLDEKTHLAYAIAYNCRGHRVEIDNGLTAKNFSISVDDRRLSKTAFMDRRDELLREEVGEASDQHADRAGGAAAQRAGDRVRAEADLIGCLAHARLGLGRHLQPAQRVTDRGG